MQARVNACNFGGNDKTAGADLMLAFLLHSARCGADPAAARDALFAPGLDVLRDLWPEAQARKH
jgi:hypothetical protein